LFILLPSSPANDDALHFDMLVVDDGATEHGPGSLLIPNFSGLALSGGINGQPLTLLSGFNAPLPVGRSASINLRTPFKDRTYQAYAETIFFNESSRALLLLLPPYHKGSMEVQSRVLLDAPRDEPGKNRRS
jgi:hypothetical protein